MLTRQKKRGLCLLKSFEMFQRNASNFAIFWEYENPHIFCFVFHFMLLDQGIYYEMKNEKTTTWVFIFQKYGKF